MFLYVGIGGSLGATLRYVISQIVKSDAHLFPLHTFIVKISGSIHNRILAHLYMVGDLSVSFKRFGASVFAVS